MIKYEIENHYQFGVTALGDSSYKTRQRELIKGCLNKNSSRSLTADELYELLRLAGTSVGKATVYRCLDALVTEGCVRKFVAHRGESAGYQYVEHGEDCSEHFHLKCTECGGLVHLGCEYMRDIDRHIFEHHDFYVDNSKTVLYGLCARCHNRLQARQEEGNI